MKRISIICLTFIFAIATFLTGMPEIYASETPQILLKAENNTTEYQTGDVFSISINAYNVSDLVGVQFILHYDPAKMQIVENGIEINSEFIDWLEIIDKDIGSITYALTTLDYIGDDIDELNVATITFKALGKGNIDLTLDNIKVVDSVPKYIVTNPEDTMAITIKDTSKDPTEPGEPTDPDPGEPTDPKEPSDPGEPGEPGEGDTYTLDRLWGENRYGTAAAISREGWSEGAEAVILVSGINFPDALAGAVLAYLEDAPILLTSQNRLNPETLEEIKRLGPERIYILGGSSAVSEEVENELNKDYEVHRIAGDNRYETAVKIGEAIKEKTGRQTFDTVIIATSDTYPDALAVGTFAGRNEIPVLFTGHSRLHGVTKQALEDWGVKNIVIVGGINAVSEDIENYLKDEMGIEINRISGDNRYMTALEIARYYEDDHDYTGIVISTGEDFADALAGAPLAAKNSYPILLVRRDRVLEEVLDYIKGLDIDKVYILGGINAVSDEVKEAIDSALNE